MGWPREPERGKIELDYRAGNRGTRYENVGRGRGKGEGEDDEKAKKQRSKNRKHGSRT